MAKLINGINGDIRGTVGSVVGSSWKGEPHIKKKYKNRTKKITPKEKGNRNKFADSQFWLQPLLDFVRVGFKGYTQRVEGFNAAKSYLSKNAFEGEQPNVRINPALMKVSFGDLPLSNDLAVELTAPGELTFTWDPAYVNDTSSRDQVMMLAYNIEDKKAYHTTTGQFRSTGADTLQLTDTRKKKPITCTWHLTALIERGGRTAYTWAR